MPSFTMSTGAGDLSQMLPGLRLSDQPELNYNGVEIELNESRLVNLTAMWRAAGGTDGQRPAQFARRAGKEFIDDLARNLNVAKCHIWNSSHGKHLGSVWAHWQIAVAYAKYLSPEFHRYVNEAFREWSQEKADPGLKLDRAIEGYRKQGKSEKWIKARLAGKIHRKEFTDTLQDHGVEGAGYGQCTDALYVPMLGRSAKQIREEKKLAKKSAATRDNLTAAELGAILFAEICATEMIDRRDVYGNRECVGCCKEAGSAAFEAIDKLGLR